MPSKAAQQEGAILEQMQMVLNSSERPSVSWGGHAQELICTFRPLKGTDCHEHLFAHNLCICKHVYLGISALHFGIKSQQRSGQFLQIIHMFAAVHLLCIHHLLVLKAWQSFALDWDFFVTLSF